METLATPESRVGKPQKRRTRAKIALIAGATLIVAGVGVAGTATAQASDWLGGVEYTQYFKNNEGLCAINVSYTDEIDKREINALLKFREKFKNTKELMIITKDLEKREKKSKIKFIPLWKWLLG